MVGILFITRNRGLIIQLQVLPKQLKNGELLMVSLVLRSVNSNTVNFHRFSDIHLSMALSLSIRGPEPRLSDAEGVGSVWNIH
ncbi:Uncharacterised protein [Kluyvera ascorbata]|nr:Uncharacterised protein [Kluyvera ascorbata]